MVSQFLAPPPYIKKGNQEKDGEQIAHPLKQKGGEEHHQEGIGDLFHSPFELRKSGGWLRNER